MNETLTPKAIVAALDAHIVGQQDAKRAVAVAIDRQWSTTRSPVALAAAFLNASWPPTSRIVFSSHSIAAAAVTGGRTHG